MRISGKYYVLNFLRPHSKFIFAKGTVEYAIKRLTNFHYKRVIPPPHMRPLLAKSLILWVQLTGFSMFRRPTPSIRQYLEQTIKKGKFPSF